MGLLTLIPDSYKIPGVAVQVDPSLAGTPVNLKPALLIGHKITAGTAPSNIPISIGRVGDAIIQFGDGSQLARMVELFLAVNPTQILLALPIPEVAAGTVATGTLTVTAGPTDSGVYSLYVAGRSVPVGVLAGDTDTAVAAKIVAAANLVTSLPVTAANAAGVVTFTAKWKGITGNDIRLETNYLGTYGGEATPAGLAITYPSGNALTGGTGVPDLSTGIAAMGDSTFKFVASAFTDTGALGLLDTEYGFTASGRWGPLRQLYGQIFCANRDTYANLAILGPTRNSPVISSMAIEPASPSPTWLWSAVYMAIAAQAFSADPARGLQTLRLAGILPAPATARFNKTQLNALAQSGFAIQGTNLDGVNDGVPAILREQSEYQRNTYGIGDNAFELFTTLSTLDEIFTRLRQAITSKFPRSKLANDGTAFGPGQAIVTPGIIKGELIAEYAQMVTDGLAENLVAFKNNLVVQRSTTNPDLMESIYGPDVINCMRRFNVLGQFRLQYQV